MNKNPFLLTISDIFVLLNQYMRKLNNFGMDSALSLSLSLLSLIHISALFYAERLIYLPQGMLAVSLVDGEAKGGWPHQQEHLLDVYKRQV